jgi:hypothetical protein
LHLITMPHFDCHTTANQEAMLVKLLGALFAGWTRKLIGVTTDGEKTNMGHINSVQVRIVRCSKFKIVQIWCVPHQLDLVLHVAIDEVDGGTWLKTAYTLSMYLCKQSNLITEMGETCPKKTNWWLALESVLKFYITHVSSIVTFLDEHREQVGNPTPPILTPSWWLLTYAFALVIAIIIETVVKLQVCNLVICQQRQLLVLLANDIRDMFKVLHIDDEANIAFNDLPITDYVCGDNSFVLLATLCEYVDDLGTRAQAHWLAIDANEKTIVLQTIAQFAINLSDGIAKVEAERDRANNAVVNLASLIMPMDLVKMRSSTFISEVIEPRKAQVQATAWTDDQINAIENDHHELFTAYHRENGISSIVDQHDHTTSFNKAWDSLNGVRFDQLRRFCTELATIVPNSTSVESDFSILKWELDEFHKSLLNLSLEGIFQAKQFELLDNIGCILTPYLAYRNKFPLRTPKMTHKVPYLDVPLLS